ncbi:MAG: hypothetical protein HY904_03335 [Deltaproteobacteria bacterium]|nr:hypothetical protein [Deltaproteobacteria bacterium]
MENSAAPVAALSASATSDHRGFRFRYRLFPLGLFTGLFDPERLVEAIREGCQDGYRLIRREFSIEQRRIAVILAALGFGLMFRRNEDNPDAEYDWRVAVYKTRFFTRTVDPEAMAKLLNDAARGGFELYYGVKYPTRLLLLFPRESYAFIFRKPIAGPAPACSYQVRQIPYRFFTRTIDAQLVERELNEAGTSRQQIKITFRDERRLFGILAQPAMVAVFERAKA